MVKLLPEVRAMNKFVRGAIAVGVGMAAYNMVRKNNLMSRNGMKKMQRRITKAIS